MGKGISYLNRNFDDYKKALMDFTKQYYPDMLTKFSDASIGEWLVDVNADIADNLSYHIDRVFQETNINTAQSRASVMAMARSNGLKIPGPKGAVAEVRFSCVVGANDNAPKYIDAPKILRGTKVGAGSQVFELIQDVDFSKQFNDEGISDRTIRPLKNSNGDTIGYELSKLAVVVAGETKVFSLEITSSMLKPFMEITLPVKGVMNIESIITREKNSDVDDFTVPENSVFYMSNEGSDNSKIKRFFEVENLTQQTIWGDDETKPSTEEYKNDDDIVVSTITRGVWKKIKNKFITEYTDSGYLKIIFGPGMENGDNVNSMDDFSKYQINKMFKNSMLGNLPNDNSMMYILYRVGGGVMSNLPKGAINEVISLKVDSNNKEKNALKTLKVVSTTSSMSGKDMPSVDEIRYMVKYNNASQGRCVTVKDYKNRILMMPSRYGTPFRVGVVEENNKIMVYLLGIDNKGKLSDAIPDLLGVNVANYLKEFRMVNDFVEIKAGKKISIDVEVKVHIDKSISHDVIRPKIEDSIKKFLDINKRDMGDDIFVGDLFREISLIRGVKNIGYIKVKDCASADDSEQDSYPIPQITIEGGYVDLESSEYILFCGEDSMIELNNIEVKTVGI